MQTVTSPYERDKSDEIAISKLLHEAVIGTAQYLSRIVTLENWAKKDNHPRSISLLSYSSTALVTKTDPEYYWHNESNSRGRVPVHVQLVFTGCRQIHHEPRIAAGSRGGQPSYVAPPLRLATSSGSDPSPRDPCRWWRPSFPA